MLTQTYRRDVPGTDAFVERTLVRDRHVCVALLRTRSIAVDSGVVAGAMRHLERFHRPQLTLVLCGRAYLDVAGREVSLDPGDAALTDQSVHRAEGYGGTGESEVVIVDWDGAGGLGDLRADGSVSRLAATDVHALRAHAASFDATRARSWLAQLLTLLRALGLPVARTAAQELAPAPAALVRVYAAVGAALSRLDAYPSVLELAESLATSERHVSRLLAELPDYDHPFTSWRELLHEMRLGWTTQLLSVPGIPLDRVARIAGYRSTTAMHHAFSLRGAATPVTIARRLADRWR